LPSEIKRNIGLTPNEQMLDNIIPAKKICKQKLLLGRVQIKQRLMMLQSHSRHALTEVSSNDEYDEQEMSPMEI